MTSPQKAKLTMYNAVISFCDKNMMVINSIPALKTSYASFTGTVTLITSTIQQKAEIITGIAIGKANARQALAREAVTLAAQIYAYANANALDELKEKVNFSVSFLGRLKDVKLPAVCKNILKAAMENVTALTAYNVTVQTNIAFSNMIKEYEAIEPAPRNAVSERVMHGASLRSLYKAADNVLKNEMDKLIDPNIDTDGGFFTTYVSNRVIVNASTTSSQIKGTVTTRDSGNPVDNAIVAIAGTDITVTTNVKGKFAMKQLAPGIYTVTVSKMRYKTLSFEDQLVKLGQITTLNGSLVAANVEVAVEKKIV